MKSTLASENLRMASSLDELKELLRRHIAGEINIDSFASGVAPIAWCLNPGDEGADLAFEVELRLAEFSNGDWTKAELRDLLTGIAAVGLD